MFFALRCVQLSVIVFCSCSICVFFFNHTPTTQIYTYLHSLSLHDALPFSHGGVLRGSPYFFLWSFTYAHDRGHDRTRGCERNAHEHRRSEEHTSELQSLMGISYAVFCSKKKN